MTVKFDIAVKAKAKHGILFRYMKENNLTYNDMSALIGISPATLIDIMHFKWLPKLTNPRSMAIIQKICLFFNCTFEEFLPPAVLETLKNNRKIRQLLQEEVVYYKEPEIDFLPDSELAKISYDNNLDDSLDQPQAIKKALSTLTAREENVIRMIYWEEKTLEETADNFDVTRERIRQIQIKALRKLQHPSRHLTELHTGRANFYPCAICDKQHLLKGEIKFLYVPGELYEKNKATLRNCIKDISICSTCAESFPHGIYTSDYTFPGKLEKKNGENNEQL